MRRAARVGAALALLWGWPFVAGAAEPVTCPDTKVPPLALPHLKQALRQNQELTIVAVGSSSTAGSRASNIGHTYPAVLQGELERELPGAHVAVLNRGVGGQDAPEMLARLEKDVLAVAPVLVIWQVGANGAMRGMNPEQFKQLVSTGVRRLEAAGADVVLMDNQRAPAILASPAHAKIDQALADVAGQLGAKLFARGRLMERWQEAGFPYDQFIADDGIHHNDRGYACVAKALAASVLAGLGPRMEGRLQAAQ